MKNFLEIVNTAIAESKVTLDPLTSANFADPPRTVLYDHFKRWVNVAYKEIVLRRTEMFTRTERALVTVWPRIHVTGLTYLPQIGDKWVAQSSSVTFTIVGVHDFEDVENDTTVERTLSIQFADDQNPSQLQKGESFDLVLPSLATGVATYKNVGFYEFSELVPNFSLLDMDTVKAYHTNDSYNGGHIINAVDWGSWDPSYYLFPWINGTPLYITRTPLGTYSLYPMLHDSTMLSFNFAKSTHQLVNWDDQPYELPEGYDDLLMWKTIEEYADWDGNTKVFSRARKHSEQYINWADRDHKPLPSMDLYRFDGHYRRQPRG